MDEQESQDAIPPLRRAVLQSATIVVGIVVALVLGSIWEYIADRLDEREYEGRLLEEFRNGSAELAADQTARSATLDRIGRLLTDGSGALSSEDSVSAYVAAIVDFRFFTPSHPVLEDLIAGGNLDILKSDPLRRGLLEYLQERDRLTVVEERERRFVAEAVEPYLVEHADIVLHQVEDWPLLTPLEDLEALATDPRFRSILSLRWERTQLAYNFAIGLRSRIDNVILLLDR